MRAIILAAGKGNRLVNITQSIPKPMIQYKGKPLLQHNIELCKSFGVEDIYINLHHLPMKITEFFVNGDKFDVNIKYSYERKLLGTSGAVKKIAEDFWNSPGSAASSSLNLIRSEPFFVVYGDNYSNYNLNLLIEKQKETNSSCVIAFHYREDTSHSGVAEFDKGGRVLRFIEKPKPGETKSHWVNAGIYLLKPEIVDYIDEGNSDFGKDVFPLLLMKNIPMFGICENSDVLAFDNPEMYQKSFENRN
jgi:mannose-1-phosphate guanylyltransferase/phosphomannomutase